MSLISIKYVIKYSQHIHWIEIKACLDIFQEQNLCSVQTDKKMKRNNLKSEDSCPIFYVNLYTCILYSYFMLVCSIFKTTTPR